MFDSNPGSINLALQGGGAHGAFTWGVLDALLQDARRCRPVAGKGVPCRRALLQQRCESTVRLGAADHGGFMRDDSAHSAGHAASRALYRWRAYSYDLQLAPYEFIRRHAVEQLQLQPGQCVLDLGCGTGMSLDLLRQAVGAQGRVIAVDQCPEMIALARSRVRQQGWRNVELLCAAVEGAPLPDAADAAFFHLTHDILQSPQAVDHVLRHLKPGARLAATGLKWTAPWLAPWNALVGMFAAQSVTTLNGLAAPWQPLLDHGAELQVETVLMGTLYVASGGMPQAAVHH